MGRSPVGGATTAIFPDQGTGPYGLGLPLKLQTPTTLEAAAVGQVVGNRQGHITFINLQGRQRVLVGNPHCDRTHRQARVQCQLQLHAHGAGLAAGVQNKLLGACLLHGVEDGMYLPSTISPAHGNARMAEKPRATIG